MNITGKVERGIKIIMAVTILFGIVYPAIDFSLSSHEIRMRWLLILGIIISSLLYMILGKIISPKWREFKKFLDDFHQFINRNTSSFYTLSNNFDNFTSMIERRNFIINQFNNVVITPKRLNRFIDEFNLLFSDFQIMVKKFIDKKPDLEKSIILFNDENGYPLLKREYEKYIDKYSDFCESLNKRLPNNTVYKLP